MYHAPAGPALGALNERARETPILDVPVTEIFRWLVSRYMDNQDSQAHMFRVEQGPTGGISVTIALEIQESDCL